MTKRQRRIHKAGLRFRREHLPTYARIPRPLVGFGKWLAGVKARIFGGNHDGA